MCQVNDPEEWTWSFQWVRRYWLRLVKWRSSKFKWLQNLEEVKPNEVLKGHLSFSSNGENGQLQVVAQQCLSQGHFPLAIWWFPSFAWLRSSHGSYALLTHASLCSCSFMCCIPCRLNLASVVSVFIVRSLWPKHKKHTIWKRVNATKLHPTLSRLLVLNENSECKCGYLTTCSCGSAPWFCFTDQPNAI